MSLQRMIIGLAAAGAAATGATTLAERRLLLKLDSVDPPAGWTRPRFPEGTQVMVPTDDGAELAVAMAGPDDGPVVVLVHGLTSNHHDWGPVAHRLVDQGHRVVGVNQRGHGGSSVGSEGFGPTRQGADLGQVLAALDLSDVTLVGHSMGGVAALSLLTGPNPTDRVSRLVLVATLADSTALDRRLSLKVGNSKRYQALADHPVHAPVGARLLFGNSPSRAMVEDALASNRACPVDTRRGAALGLLDYDVRALLPKVTVATVVLCGDKDRATSLDENRAIARAIPGAQLIVVPGAGHMIIWEAADMVADAIVAITTSTRHQAHARDLSG